MRRSPEATRGADGRHGSPWRAVGAALVALLALVGAGFIGASLNAAPALRPPQPLAEAGPTELEPTATPSVPEETPTDESSSATPEATPEETPEPIGLERSEPTDITIPAIGVAAKLMTLGVNPDGTVQVPPLRQPQLAGWYQPGPSPGEIGNAVIVGHVDSQAGPAVFFELGALKAGDIIKVTRKDKTIARFVVEEVKSYPKTAFPTELVYGPTDEANLRVVTCGGDFDPQARSYLNNIIVLATLVS